MLCGKKLDTFNTDLIVDLSAHQTLLQIIRREGDIVISRAAGGDLSSKGDNLFILNDVPSVFEVFNDMTFALSSINLKDTAAMGLGERMGAVIYWEHQPDGPPKRKIDKSKETVLYDSAKTERSCLSYICNAECCLQPEYKITSERVMYMQWDYWHLCDNPFTACCLPCYCINSCMGDCCCTREDALRQRIGRLASGKAASARSQMSGWHKCCAVPVGRTIQYFDIDIIVDVGTRQRCRQLCLSEGDLLIYRIPGGDSDDTETIFTLRNVPNVFSKFDQLSLDLAKMDLSHYQRNAMHSQVMSRS
jgi:hypothetical protein